MTNILNHIETRRPSDNATGGKSMVISRQSISPILIMERALSWHYWRPTQWRLMLQSIGRLSEQSDLLEPQANIKTSCGV